MALYQLDGSVNCQDSTVTTPEQARATLEQLDVKVTSSESRAVPFHISGACGTPTGGAVVLVVNAGDWNRAIKKRPDAHGFGAWVFDRPQAEHS